MAHAQLKQTRLVLSELQAQVAARRGATASPGEPINRRLDLAWLSEHLLAGPVRAVAPALPTSGSGLRAAHAGYARPHGRAAAGSVTVGRMAH